MFAYGENWPWPLKKALLPDVYSEPPQCHGALWRGHLLFNPSDMVPLELPTTYLFRIGARPRRPSHDEDFSHLPSRARYFFHFPDGGYVLDPVKV